MGYENTAKRRWFRDYDGYKSEPIWHRDKGDSSYFSQLTDTQCSLPLPSIEELERQMDSHTNY